MPNTPAERQRVRGLIDGTPEGPLRAAWCLNGPNDNVLEISLKNAQRPLTGEDEGILIRHLIERADARNKHIVQICHAVEGNVWRVFALLANGGPPAVAQGRSG